LKRNSRLKHGASLALLAGLIAPAAHAQMTVGSGPVPSAETQRLNPTGRPISLTVPAKDGVFYLGDIAVTISPEDKVEFSSQRLLDILSSVLDARVLEGLRTELAGRATITPQELRGVRATYNPQTIELVLDIPPQMKAVRSLTVAPLDQARIGAFERPALMSGYVNVRGSADYVHEGAAPGWGDPVVFLDGAMRYGAAVVESEAVWQPGADTTVQRLGSRFVFDDTGRAARWTAGDLLATGRGFQSAPDLFGLSVFRSYSVLQPQRNVSPRGDQTFSLTRPSTVEVFVNGQSVRRLRLDPGSYNLRDFPFTQGANDIRLAIEDDTGSRETVRFNVFFDRSQLAPGLSEFGVYAGARSILHGYGPSYDGGWAVSGFYRHGLTETLTLGANAQADEESRMAGLEGVWGARIGTIGFDLAMSNLDDFGSGYAGTLTFQRLFQMSDGRADAFNLFVQTRSRDFASMGSAAPDNRYEFEAGAGYSHAFSDAFYAGLDARFSKGRGLNPDIGVYRASFGYRLSPSVGLSIDTTYQDAPGQREVAVLLSLTTRLGPWSSVQADYDTSGDRARLSYQTLHGEGVGAYNLSADVEHSPDGSGLNATANYFANRAELGASHFTTFDDDFGAVRDQRTSLRLATAFAFADGAASIGRPVYDAFAVVKPHSSLRGADVLVNPTPDSYTAHTGLLGSALTGNLAAYAERTVTVDAVGAPQGYDIGTGAYRLLPPYRAGYKLEVGSAYSVTAIGRLLDEDGAPIALLGGKAVEVAHPERDPVTVFTNREGRFGAAGLAPGRWLIEMPSSPPAVFVLDVPAAADGVVRAGDLKPVER
jgi:outer membrane usher protein